MPRSKALIGTLSLATTLFVPAAFAQNTNQARPGTLNYIEGQASLNGQPLAANAAGHADIAQGQTLATANGKAEVLLTPGVFLRLGENSSVTMVSPDLTKTEVQLNQGRAEVEVDQIFKQNDLLVDQGPAQTKLLQHGLYEFDATNSTMRVFDGKAAVSPAQNAAKWITVKGGHELALNGDATKTTGFDRDQASNQDPLYQWGSLRADYLGKANLELAQQYEGGAGFYPGWYWSPALYGYTWLPGDGLFWSPFGYGFYSPYYLGAGGFIYSGYGLRTGFYRGGYGFRGGYAVHAAPAVRSGYAGGFHGGFAGGGFHGGMAGGFHGGGGRR